jgi:hypothetical protein
VESDDKQSANEPAENFDLQKHGACQKITLARLTTPLTEQIIDNDQNSADLSFQYYSNPFENNKHASCDETRDNPVH